MLRRFQREAAEVAGELAAFAALERTTVAQFQASIAEQMGRIFTPPAAA